MKYTDKSRFTEEQINLIEGVAKVVCHVYDITVDELRNNVRKRIYTDPRKLFCNFVVNNFNMVIPVGKPGSGFTKIISSQPLLSWYLNQCHSTVIHAIAEADSLYKIDSVFRHNFDVVVRILNNPNYDVEIDNKEVAKLNGITWEALQYDDNVSMTLRIRLMPRNIGHMISNMYMKGYGVGIIANEVKVSVSFVQQYVIKKGLRVKRAEKRVVNKKLYSTISRVTPYQKVN